MEYLYKGIFPKVKMYILGNAGNKDDAFDIFQDGIMILCKYIQTGKYNTEHELSAFIYVVCKNLWTNKAKRENKMSFFPENFDISDQSDFTDYIVTKEKKQVLDEIIEKLGQKCYQLLQYSIFFKYGTDEIIDKMGFASANAVKTQKYKCKQKLANILEEKNSYKDVIE